MWFLAVLSICLFYLMASLFNRKFPVYKLSMITVTVLYITLAFAHPDYYVAKYDLKMLEESSGGKIDVYDTAEDSPGTYYLRNEISADAVPAYVDYPELLAAFCPDDFYVYDGVPYTEEYKEIRRFNFARYKAYKLCSPYHK